MRVNSLIYLLSFFLFSYLTSCTKNDNPTSISGKVKTEKYSFGDTGLTITSYYDDNGRITNANTTRNPGNHFVAKQVWSFTTNTILEEYFDSSNLRYHSQEYNLNSLGLVDTLKILTPGVDSFRMYIYIYNANNELINYKYFVYYPATGQISNYERFDYEVTFTNGDLIKLLWSKYNTQESGIVNYEYYNTVSNLTPEAFGLPYSLLQSNHLLKKQTYINQDPRDNFTINHSYMFDANNRVSSYTYSSIENDPSNNKSATIYYTYY